MILIFLCFAALSLLVYERISLDRRLRRIPLRICVTGTRGKSGVARMLASVLRSQGRTVLAKTTGSQARLILPDGTDVEVPRLGPATILEQKKLVRKAAELEADCLVCEVMSVQPETHRVEGRQLLKPHILAVTNVRPDHTEMLGSTAREIASAFALTACPATEVFLSPGIPRHPFLQAAGGGPERVRSVSSSGCPDAGRAWDFEENVALVYSIARHLGVPDPAIAHGILNTRHDEGRLQIWACTPPGRPCTCYLVNAFAANDPESTARVLARVRALLPERVTRIAGIMNLREDRIPRTLQWIEALKGPASAWFRRLYVTGKCARPLRRRFSNACFLECAPPGEIMRTIFCETSEDSVLFGFGNFAGAGRLLVQHWAAIGVPYGI